jgi:hypothetical protein
MMMVIPITEFGGPQSLKRKKSCGLIEQKAILTKDIMIKRK